MGAGFSPLFKGVPLHMHQFMVFVGLVVMGLVVSLVWGIDMGNSTEASGWGVGVGWGY